MIPLHFPIRSCITAFLWAASGSVVAQNERAATATNAFTFDYANDFFRATDRYFTQGVRLELASPILGRVPLRKILPGMGNSADQEHVLFAEQNCYTPRSIRRDTVLRDDRPFAAALFIGQRRTSVDAVHGVRLTSAIMLGVLGPCAVCAEEQRAIHAALDNIAPLGWQFQVANDVIANMDLQVEQQLLRTRFLELSVAGSVRVGTFHDQAGIGGRLEVGRFRSDLGMESRHGFELSLFVSGRAHAVAYDATLQGGLFNHSSVHVLPHGSIEPLVGQGELGARARLGMWDLLFAHVYTSRDFKNGMPHAWGELRIVVHW
ncbi:MAG: lipid A deacylase LpxR family protein [Flavobacteriales bacterium]